MQKIACDRARHDMAGAEQRRGVQSSAERDKQGRQTDKLVKGYARPANVRGVGWRGRVQGGRAGCQQGKRRGN